MIGHDAPSLGGEVSPTPDEQRQRAWHTKHTVLLIVSILVVALAAASLISIPYYAITPGSAQPIGRLIGIPSSVRHQHKGSVLLVDVQLVPLRAIEWPFFALDSNTEIVPTPQLLGTSNPAQYQTEGEIDMARAQQAATVVALNELGYHVSVKENGALLYALEPGSPGEQHLAVGDVVTAVNGHAVANAGALGSRIDGHRPGDRLAFTVHVTPAGATHRVTVALGSWRIKGRGKNATLQCAAVGQDTRLPVDHISPATGKHVSSAPCIGALNVETDYAVGKLPFKVNLASEGIVGPSAGLSFTLGLMQQLDPLDLTGGHLVAATGTMSVTGAIGDVGGVAQKTVAVRSSGAKVFLVPPQEYKVALAHAGSGLRVYSVSSIGQALKILRSYGGKLPANPSNSKGLS